MNHYYVPETEKKVARCLMGRSCFFEHVEYTLLQTATKSGQVTARCSVLINRRYQRDRDADVGFIGHFAARPEHLRDVERLLSAAEDWLAQKGIVRVIAPCNGAAMLGMGLLTAAFDQSPMFPLRWTPPYYQDYLLSNGYQARYPFWIYKIDLRSEKYRAASEACNGTNIRIRPLNKKHWNQELELLRDLFNETFKDEWEFHQHTSGEFHEFFDQLRPVLDPKQVLFAEVAGKPVGWCLGFPDWTPLLRSFNGKLGPIQSIRFLFRSRHYDRAGLVGIGVLPDYQATGAAQSLAVSLFGHYKARGLDEALYYAVNDRNMRSRKFAESLGGRGAILYHCFDKRIG